VLGDDDMPADLAADLEERVASVDLPPSWFDDGAGRLCSLAALGRNPCVELADDSATMIELLYHQSRSEPFPVTFFVMGGTGLAVLELQPEELVPGLALVGRGDLVDGGRPELVVDPSGS
jgi:hypothetical protein